MKTHMVLSYCIILLAFFSACNQEDDSTYRLNTRQVKLNCRDSLVLKVTPALQGLSYTSLNANIATVSKDGLIKAKLVGCTKIVVKDSLNVFVDTVKVEVNPVNTLFGEPYLGFGINHTTLLETLNITDYYFWYPPFGDGFRVNLVSKGRFWGYNFKENKYNYLIVEVPEAQYALLDLHLNDRYNLMTTKSYSAGSNSSIVDTYYINPDSSLIIKDYRYSHNSSSMVYFYQATQEKIQLVFSDENYIDLE